MNGSLPPSSSTLFLMLLRRRCDATLAPAGSLPVSVAAFTRSSSRSAATCSDADEQRLKLAAIEARLAKDVLDRERATAARSTRA